MSEDTIQSKASRRRFLSRIAVGAGAGLAAGTGVIGSATIGAPPAAAQAAAETSWRPAHHAQDDWLEAMPGQHRMVFDATTADGVALALQFGGNYFAANQNAYALKDSDLAVVIVLRHKATSFGYNDAMWAKYGKYFSTQSGFIDPKTNQPPMVNVYASGDDSRLSVLARRGVRFAVCETATRAILANLLKVTGAEADKVVNELVANFVPNARLVPAGIVTVNRAQERGYSFAHAI